MFLKISEGLICEACKEGVLIYDAEHTYEDYMRLENIEHTDLDRLIDEAINDYLLFRCSDCGTVFKLTYKQLEKRHRQILSKRVISAWSAKEIRDAMTHPELDRSMVYCGKCTGFDGKGACQTSIYKNCKLKRLPYGF